MSVCLILLICLYVCVYVCVVICCIVFSVIGHWLLTQQVNLQSSLQIRCHAHSQLSRSLGQISSSLQTLIYRLVGPVCSLYLLFCNLVVGINDA